MVLDSGVADRGDAGRAKGSRERDPLLDQALESLRAALTQARDAAQVALADLALEPESDAGAQGGPRYPRDRLAFARNRRDGRICDLIDSQVGALEGAAARSTPADLATALSGAFDLIEEKK